MTRPPSAVLTAFDVSGHAVRLRGGQGRAYRVGEVVLKPVEDPAEAAFVAGLCVDLQGEGFRVPRPLPTTCAAWLHDGWSAWRFVEGRDEPGRYAEMLRACLAFHRAVRDVPRPAFLDTRGDPWARADRIAWQEAPADLHPVVAEPVRRLIARYRPVDAPPQLIHGDFGGGNLLFEHGHPPAVIDIAVYWRPVGFAAAVPLVDAVVWEGAALDVLDLLRGSDGGAQYLLRAEVRRLVEIDGHARIHGAHRLEDVAAHAALVEHLAG